MSADERLVQILRKDTNQENNPEPIEAHPSRKRIAVVQLTLAARL